MAKNRDDQRTVLLGLPAIMGALLGGGPQNNAFSWLDEFRSRRTASIVNSTFVDIYTETAKDVLAELIFRHGSTACGVLVSDLTNFSQAQTTYQLCVCAGGGMRSVGKRKFGLGGRNIG